jgi:hypothetical protein
LGEKKEETGRKRAVCGLAFRVSGRHHEAIFVSTTVRAGGTKRAQGHDGGGAERLKEPSSCSFSMARRSLPSWFTETVGGVGRRRKVQMIINVMRYLT